MPELVAADRLAELAPGELALAIRPLFEDSELLAARLAGRPFSSWDDVIDASRSALRDATDSEKAEIMRSHPRLGAPPEELRERSETSWLEQGGEVRRDVTVLERLAAANDRYEERFGFPFVDWVAGRPLEDMILVIESRLASDPADELCRGCLAIVDIARDRLDRIERRDKIEGGG